MNQKQKKLVSTIAFIVISVIAAYYNIDISGNYTGSGGSQSEEVVSSYRVSDGDTINIGNERVRILGLDTPEVFNPNCTAEKDLGDKATNRLKSLLASGTVTIERDGVDQYDRTLAIIRVDGRDIAPIMIQEGYALSRKPREGWCARIGG